MARFDLAALLLSLAAALSWLNRKLLRLPHEIGLVVTGLALLLLLSRALLPDNPLEAVLADALKHVDFTDVVMNGMLAFLVFAGAFSRDGDGDASGSAVDDGVGILIVTVLVGYASGDGDLGAGGVALAFLRETGGGISIALALAEGGPKPTILAATYAVVIFTVVVQGATLKRVARLTLTRPRKASP